jgi:predicted transposase YbfD/YdcC
LDLLEIKGCVVSIDAMGCQKKIAEKIVEKQADWVFSLKGNQSTFHQDVIAWFESVDLDQCCRDASVFLETKEKKHGRLETRRYYYFTDHSLGHYAEQWIRFPGYRDGRVDSR